MSTWLKKILGKNTKEAPAVSNPSRTKLSRAERVFISDLHNISCQSASPELEIDGHSILNLSLSGVAFTRDWIRVNGQLPVDLKLSFMIDGKLHQVSGKVAQFNDRLLGVAFVEPSFEFTAALNNYFQVEIAALQISEVDSSLLKAVPRGKAHWFEGNRNTGLYYVSEGETILTFSITFFGNVVRLSESGQLEFGKIQNSQNSKFYESGSEFIADSVWPENMKLMLSRFVMAISALKDNQRSCIMAQIAKIPTSVL